VSGAFAFTSPSTAPNAGTANQGITFTPTDSANYNTATGTVSVAVAKATSSITSAPTASGITYGQTLADSSLSGGSGSVTGSFAFTSPSTAPNAGTANQGITFTPDDTTNYNSATGTVSVAVAKATSSITSAPTASGITYGQTLADSTLSGGSGSVAGSFAFTSPSTAPNAGTANQGITFTPTDSANYNTATGTVSVAVAKATPSITAVPTATAITYGQSLADSTLNNDGTASVSGSFAFSSASDTPAGAGSYSAGVTFTPTDTSNYNTTSTTVTVTVNKASQTITFPWLPNGTVGGSAALTATSNAGLTISYSSSDTSVATISGSTVNFVGAGLVSITASQAGDSNYEAASDETITFSVLSATTPAEDYLSNFGLTGANAALTADPDGDGLTNAAEFAFGTDPTAGTDNPVTVSDSGSSLTITFLGRTSGVDYVVKTTTDLSSGFSGTNAPTPVSPQPSGLPSGYTQYEASVDMTSGDRNFLKVDATIQ
jgi:hypothetical protein